MNLYLYEVKFTSSDMHVVVAKSLEEAVDLAKRLFSGRVQGHIPSVRSAVRVYSVDAVQGLK